MKYFMLRLLGYFTIGLILGNKVDFIICMCVVIIAAAIGVVGVYGGRNSG